MLMKAEAKVNDWFLSIKKCNIKFLKNYKDF